MNKQKMQEIEQNGINCFHQMVIVRNITYSEIWNFNLLLFQQHTCHIKMGIQIIDLFKLIF